MSGRSTLVMIVAGEASGDQHAAGLVKEVLARDPAVRFCGMAGPEMRAAGVEPLVDATHVGVVGIAEVVRHLPRIRAAFETLARAMESRRPDLLVPVDFPDFNLRLAARGKRLGIPVLYFVSPQVWAWRSGRIRTIAKRVDRMMVLFRFEEEIYRDAGIPVDWVGHPLADRPHGRLTREEARRRLGVASDVPAIALLPGSREAEVRRILPVLLDASAILAGRLGGAEFLVALGATLDRARVGRMCVGRPVRIVEGDLEGVLAASDAAAVASGTATLETALAGTPMVIVYRVSPLTAFIGRRLIRIRDIGLANLVAGRRVASELVQEDCRPERVASELMRLLDPEQGRSARAGLAEVRSRLGEPGAFGRAASVVLEMIERASSLDRRPGG